MTHTYTTRFDYFMLLFFCFGGGAMGYAFELGYAYIIGCGLLIPFLILLFSFAQSDLEVQLDGIQRQLIYTYNYWGKRRTKSYPLDELTFTYSSMFTQHGKWAKLHIYQGKKTVYKPSISARSLHVEQQEHLADCLQKLGVKQR
ncbi:hypothetical protein [Myroides sp. WP-1]|uniref:hypothetical protein n=1 Tax=Myroides sp. WP-1 TaxID=2759944 RepID=UPI0015F89E2B|nr:hypothetical protein [Myroides sp. WP-1]MBB1140084.1 hypothetical protein [Myroides sp. WP-1]